MLAKRASDGLPAESAIILYLARASPHSTYDMRKIAGWLVWLVGAQLVEKHKQQPHLMYLLSTASVL